MTSANTLALIPAVEFILPDLPNRGPIPTLSRKADPESWTARRAAELIALGLKPIDSVLPGSFAMALTDILDEPEILRAVLEEHCRASNLNYLPEPAQLDERLTAFSGGLAVRYHDEIVFEPQCCCDLTNIWDWESLLEHTEADETALWVGHPQLLVSYHHSFLNFRASEEWETRFKFEVTPEELRVALSNAKSIQSKFSEALLPVVAAKFGRECHITSQYLAGLLP